MKAFQSVESTPSQAPSVPPEPCSVMRCVGGLTHKRLVDALDHGVA